MTKVFLRILLRDQFFVRKSLTISTSSATWSEFIFVLSFYSRRSRGKFWRSDHGTVRALHLEELDDEGRAAGDDLRWELAEWAVLDAHDGQLAAQRQLERQPVQVWVIVQVQFLQVLQGAWGTEWGGKARGQIGVVRYGFTYASVHLTYQSLRAGAARGSLPVPDESGWSDVLSLWVEWWAGCWSGPVSGEENTIR